MYIPNAINLATIIVAFSEVYGSEYFVTEDVIVTNTRVQIWFMHTITKDQYTKLRTVLPPEFTIVFGTKVQVSYDY